MSIVPNVGYRLAAASEAVALIDVGDADTPVRHTYRDVGQRADAYAQTLRDLGLPAGSRIGILADNSGPYLFAWFGILRAGMVVVPINHKLSQASIRHILADAEIRAVFCDRERQRNVPDDIPGHLLTRDGVGDRIDLSSDRIDADAIAVILYTSGSTGTPKGVPVTHAAFNWILDTRLRGGPFEAQRLLVAAPLYHINALGAATFTLAAGASLVLLPRFDAKRYIHAIGAFACTWLTSVPAMLAMAMRETDSLNATDLSSVKYVRMGSSPISARLITQVRSVFPHAVLSNSYGTTEAGPVVFGPHRDGRQPPDGAAGWPVTNVEVRLLDSDGREADEGVLLMRTPATMKGYLNLPAKTAEVLTADGWYISGDIFRRDADGVYWFVGRNDDMFVCGGENIHPQEVERLLESHPAVLQACVVAVPDELKGAKPFAFVVARAGHAPSADALKRHVLDNGPAYLHPRHVVFLDSLPLAGTNKVDRKQLAGLALGLLAAAHPDDR